LATISPDADNKPQRAAAVVGGANGLAAMEGSMNEAELDRLRRAVKRLMNGQQEALEAIAQAFEESEGIEQDILVDLQDILEGAYEDAQNILGDSEGGEL